MKYRKKPVVVEAVRFTDTEESISKLSELGLDTVQIDYADAGNPILKIETLEQIRPSKNGGSLNRPKHKKASDVRPLDIINVLIAIGSLIMTFLGWLDD